MNTTNNIKKIYRLPNSECTGGTAGTANLNDWPYSIGQRNILFQNIKIIQDECFLVYETKTAEVEMEKMELPERLTNPQYGSAELEKYLIEMAKNAPGIEKIWEITKDLPSLTQMLLEEREDED